MLNISPTEFTITRMKHYPENTNGNGKKEMLYLWLNHAQVKKKSNITYTSEYVVACFGMACAKIREYYQEKDKITPKIVVTSKWDSKLNRNAVYLNSSYPPAENTGTKKGNVFND